MIKLITIGGPIAMAGLVLTWNSLRYLKLMDALDKAYSENGLPTPGQTDGVYWLGFDDRPGDSKELRKAKMELRYRLTMLSAKSAAAMVTTLIFSVLINALLS